jgi:hypothetical protein
MSDADDNLGDHPIKKSLQAVCTETFNDRLLIVAPAVLDFIRGKNEVSGYSSFG